MRKIRSYILIGIEGIIVIFVLFWAISLIPAKQNRNPVKSGFTGSTLYPAPLQITEQPTQTTQVKVDAYPPPIEPTIQAKSNIQPPICKNKSLLIENLNSQSLETLSISEPEVLFESSAPIGIADWLPDNQNILIAKSLLNGSENIESLNVKTKEDQQIITRQTSGSKPIWLDGNNSLVYADLSNNKFGLVVFDKTKNKFNKINQDLFNFSLSSNGTDLAFFSLSDPDKLQLWNSNSYTISLNYDLSKYKYQTQTNNSLVGPGKTFQTTWQPNGNNIALFGIGYLYLFDIEDQSVCEAPINQYYKSSRIYKSVKWSSDGKFLAVVSTDLESQMSTSENELIIWNITDNNIIKPEIKTSFIYGITWSGSSNTLAFLSKEGITPLGAPIMNLFLVSIENMFIKQINSKIQFGGGSSDDWQLSWSHDGSELAVKCPLWQPNSASIKEDRICLISIK
jgi:dipeptidyl aminopeptidase/acylaminoacyl peptidase